MPGKKDAPWERIRMEYVTGELGFRALAQKYGVTLTQVGNRSKSERWVEQRQQYRDSVWAKTMDSAVEEGTGQLLSLRRASLALADKIAVFLTETKGRELTLQDGTNVRAFASTLKDLVGVVRDLYGIPTRAEQEAEMIAKRRLELEELRSGSREDNKLEVLWEEMPE